jgi:hypothetical protein
VHDIKAYLAARNANPKPYKWKAEGVNGLFWPENNQHAIPSRMTMDHNGSKARARNESDLERVAAGVGGTIGQPASRRAATAW